MKYHMIAFFAGFCLDMLFGDPYWLPHPVRLIGSLISSLERMLIGAKGSRKEEKNLHRVEEAAIEKPGRKEEGREEQKTEQRRKERRKTEQGTEQTATEENKKETTEQTVKEEQKAKQTIKKEQRTGRQEERRSKENSEKFRKGIILAVTVPIVSALVSALLLVVAYKLHPVCGVMIEAIMTYQILAAKCLKVESMKVYKSLKEEGLASARRAVSMIVGRDTQVLDETGVAKAAIETVAENTSDGVIAPMLYTALGGPVFGFVYKAINTMDSMVGYKNDRYLYFGRAAAKLDDVANYLPARISAFLMIGCAFIGGKEFDGRRAFRIYKRDNRKHASPNSAQTEAVCAGALGIQLAGDASYFGKVVKKPHIGDPVRAVEFEDIRRVNKLMYLTAWAGELLCLLAMWGVGTL